MRWLSLLRSKRTLGWALMAVLAALGPETRTLAQPESRMDIRALLVTLDKNMDFQLERTEIPENGLRAFDALLRLGDGNSNGRLEREEIEGLLLRAARSRAPEFLRSPEKLMERDTNKDGQVGQDEFQGPAQVCTLLDANKDGKISKEEAQRLSSLPGLGVAAGAGMIAERLATMDANGDGQITREEFTGPPQIFDRFDADKDGKISKEEATRSSPLGAAAGVGAGALMGRIREMDANRDGKVSQKEFTGPAQLFERLDTNKDGFIDREDMAAGGAALKKAMEFRKKAQERRKDANTRPTPPEDKTKPVTKPEAGKP